jgi:hypothetical protein
MLGWLDQGAEDGNGTEDVTHEYKILIPKSQEKRLFGR